MGKLFPSMSEAVADVQDGARVMISGFTGPGTPRNLIRALIEQGAKDLTIILNSPGRTASYSGGALVESGQVRRLVSAFTALTRDTSIPFEKLVEAGELETELMPQGTLAERLRAGGAGIGAFYTPTGVGTEMAEGRETREFGGREYLLEFPLRADFAIIRAHRADTSGNVSFRLAQRNFGPLMAFAADTAIIEVEQPIVRPGELDPDSIHIPGIVVSRMVEILPPPCGLWDEGDW